MERLGLTIGSRAPCKQSSKGNRGIHTAIDLEPHVILVVERFSQTGFDVLFVQVRTPLLSNLKVLDDKVPFAH